MDGYALLIGNRNHSSWSLRGWLAVKAAGVPVAETVVPLFRRDTRRRMAAFSDAPPLVPVLKRGDLVVWDSLAILETMAELSPEAGLWPSDPDGRAEARAVVAEMHAGFTALRRHMPMAIRERIDGRLGRRGVAADLDRLWTVWRRCLGRAPGGGPFLFGPWSAADIAFTPVATRLRTYGVPVPDDLRPYAEALLAHPLFRAWEAEATAEPWTVAV